MGVAGVALLAVVALGPSVPGGALGALAPSGPLDRLDPVAAATPIIPAGLPAGIEGLAPYVKQSSCDPVPKPGSTALGRLLDATYPGSSYAVARSCAGDTSEHYEGRAVDWFASVRVPAQAVRATALIAWLFATDAQGHPYANARRLGIMYVIWNNRIWGSYAAGSGWRPYNGCAAQPAASADTICHRDHIHLSLSWAGALGRTSFWTRAVAPDDFGPCRPADLNFAPPYTRAQRQPCPAYPTVRAPATGTAVRAALVRYSGAVVGASSTGVVVTAVQRALGVSADGGFGPATVRAVAAFQTRRGLAASGRVDAATWRALLGSTPGPTPSPTPSPGSSATPGTSASGLHRYATSTLRSGAHGAAVLALQKALRVKPLDGQFGPITRTAVVAFQRSHHLSATGIVTASTWRALGA